MTSLKSKNANFIKDKETLIFFLERFSDEIQYKIINLIYKYTHENNIYINRYGELKDNINILKICSIEEINTILMNIIFILSQQLTYIITYDYTYIIDFLLKSSCNLNKEIIEPKFNNDEINSYMKVIADKVIDANNMTLKSIETDEDLEILISNLSTMNLSKDLSGDKEYTSIPYLDIYNINIDYQINIFKIEIPRKIIFLIDLMINLSKE
jgi:hypothetical protein